MNCSNNAFGLFNTSLSQLYHQPQAQDDPQNRSMFLVPQPYVSGSLLSPPCYHSPGAMFRVTPVEQMTIDQTANWIVTVGRYYG